MSEPGEFQRARRPEQIAARRELILTTAEQMLTERPLAEISLRALSQRVGLAKSNVLRYFDSREAVFIELLGRDSAEWLDALEAELAQLPGPERGDPQYGQAVEVAWVTARTLAARPLLCELISSSASILEWNISLELARDFKRRSGGSALRLAGLIDTHVPGLGLPAAHHFAAAVYIITAGMYPYARPSATVQAVNAELGLPSLSEAFPANLQEGLANQLVGLMFRGPTGVRPVPSGHV